ncbi:transmembrane protein, putative, partial [Bodo saltans]
MRSHIHIACESIRLLAVLCNIIAFFIVAPVAVAAVVTLRCLATIDSQPQELKGGTSYEFIGNDSCGSIIRTFPLICQSNCSNIHVVFRDTSVVPLININSTETILSNVSVLLDNVSTSPPFVGSQLSSSRMDVPSGLSILNIATFGSVIRGVELVVNKSQIFLSTSQDAATKDMISPVFLLRLATRSIVSAFTTNAINVTILDSIVDLACNNSRATAIMWEPARNNMFHSQVHVFTSQSMFRLFAVQPSLEFCGDQTFRGSAFVFLLGSGDAKAGSNVEDVSVTLLDSIVYIQYARAPTRSCDKEGYAAILHIRLFGTVARVTFYASNVTSTVGFSPDVGNVLPPPLSRTSFAASLVALPPAMERWQLTAEETKFISSVVEIAETVLISEVRFELRGCQFQILGNAFALALHLYSRDYTLQNRIVVSVNDSFFEFFATGGYLHGRNLRIASLVYVQEANQTMNSVWNVVDSNITSNVLSGGGNSVIGAVASVFAFDCSIINSTFYIDHVSLVTENSNGSTVGLAESLDLKITLPFPLFVMGIASSFVTFQPTNKVQNPTGNVAVVILHSSLTVLNQSFASTSPSGAATSIITFIQAAAIISASSFRIEASAIAVGYSSLPTSSCQNIFAICGEVTAAVAAVDSSQLLFELFKQLGLGIYIGALIKEIGDRSGGASMNESRMEIIDVDICCQDLPLMRSTASSVLKEVCAKLLAPQLMQNNVISISSTKGTSSLSSPPHGNEWLPRRCVRPNTPLSLWSPLGLLGGAIVRNVTLVVDSIATPCLHLLAVVDPSFNSANPVVLDGTTSLTFRRMTVQWPEACGVNGETYCHNRSIFSCVNSKYGALKLYDSAQIVIDGSTFSGFDSVSSVVFTSVAKTNESRLRLGCNQWNNEMLNINVANATIPLKIDYLQSINNSFVVTQENSSDGGSSSSILVCKPATAAPVATQLPSTLGDQLSGAAAPFFASAGVGAAVISGNVGALGDLQVLFAASSSVCAPSGLRSMGKSSSFLLSPFTSLDGEAYQVIGNIGILACIVALHAGAVAVVAWRRQNSFADTVKLEKRSQPSQRDGQTIPASSSGLLPPEAVLQFPNLSFVAALLLAPGVARTIPLLISASGEGSSVALQLTVGVVAVIALSIGVYWRAWLVVSTPLFSRLRFVPYRRSELDSVRLFNGSTS